jgi:hypothetical protein
LKENQIIAEALEGFVVFKQAHSFDSSFWRCIRGADSGDCRDLDLSRTDGGAVEAADQQLGKPEGVHGADASKQNFPILK